MNLTGRTRVEAPIHETTRETDGEAGPSRDHLHVRGSVADHPRTAMTTAHDDRTRARDRGRRWTAGADSDEGDTAALTIARVRVRARAQSTVATGVVEVSSKSHDPPATAHRQDLARLCHIAVPTADTRVVGDQYRPRVDPGLDLVRHIALGGSGRDATRAHLDRDPAPTTTVELGDAGNPRTIPEIVQDRPRLVEQPVIVVAVKPKRAGTHHHHD